MNPNNDILMHYGMPRRSGRYPWGSGEDPYQHGRDFLSRVEELKKQGWTETPENIKKEFGITTTQYRTEKSLAKNERRMLQVATAKSLREDDHLGWTEIARKMGLPNESTARSLLNEKSETRMKQARKTADFIKEQIESSGMLIDVGAGVENQLNISKEKLNEALALLKSEGYPVFGGRVDQVTNPGQKTTLKVIGPKNATDSDFYKFQQGELNIRSLNEYITRDGGQTFEKKFHYPESMDSKRLMIRYNEDGGLERDGIVEIRRGVQDLSLGESKYAQVRILVDGDRYIKGMAVYSDNMPDGVDVIFNTNKKAGTPMADVLKKIKDDPDNPFGSAIKDAEQGGQYWYTDKKTGEKKLGLINKRADEGDWTEWKDALPSQFLSKQPIALAKKQLNLAAEDKIAEFNDICSINNPTIKKYYLDKFASECDSAAVHLQAAALPGQKYHVIIPINSLSDNEVYAPNYENGTKLALIRYPHGGTFEIPILTVNNKNKDGQTIITNDSIDAVGINKKVADRLSGADFDGDTVMCIPTHDAKGKVKIKSTPELEGLKGFDPKEKYGYDSMTKDPDGTEHYYRNGHEFRVMSESYKQKQMGVASNLITDMTLLGATDAEKAAAVRHSMVVIDAAKHKLDYKQSEIDNNISALKKKYQIKYDEDGNIVGYGGASTIISKAKSVEQVTKRQGTPKINIPGKEWYDPSKPEGSLIYKDAYDAHYTSTKVNKKTGEVVTVNKTRTQDSTKMAETDDATTLVSKARTPMELEYANYANRMKALANKARMEMVSTGNLQYSDAAAKTYKEEVSSLNAKLNDALKNSPRERMAMLRANVDVNAKIKAVMDANPGMSRKEASKQIDTKKAGTQALSKYRQELGSVSRKKRNIKITDREWEAIQAGAVHESTLKKILNNADADDLRQRATPKSSTSLSPAKINRIKSLSASNYTLSEIANKLGVSTSTVSKYLKGVN